MLLPAVALLLLVGIVVSYELRRPPLERFRQAMDALEAARTAQAEYWDGDTYHEAREYLIAGQQVMAKVNTAWWPFESYQPADSLLTESIRLSNLAVLQAGNKQLDQEKNVESDIARFNDSLDVWRKILDNSLPGTENDLLYHEASFNLQMSENMLKKNQLETAGEYADTVRAKLRALQLRHEQQLAAGQKWIRKSQEWAAQTVKESKISGQNAFIVDKTKHRLYILSAGKVVDSIICDLGYNSGHQKMVSGDGATPEGKYRVTKINRSSKYYMALLLDYPNGDDRRRFQSNRLAGTIPAFSKIGGLIEIHGFGGTSRDWTDGCVAVTDADMDRLLRVVSIGTPVTIVRTWEER